MPNGALKSALARGELCLRRASMSHTVLLDFLWYHVLVINDNLCDLKYIFQRRIIHNGCASLIDAADAGSNTRKTKKHLNTM